MRKLHEHAKIPWVTFGKERNYRYSSKIAILTGVLLCFSWHSIHDFSEEVSRGSLRNGHSRRCGYRASARSLPSRLRRGAEQRALCRCCPASMRAASRRSRLQCPPWPRRRSKRSAAFLNLRFKSVVSFSHLSLF